MNDDDIETLRMRRQLWWSALIEGATLLMLVCIAVPLKHLAGSPEMVRVLGPVHGIAFIFYIWTSLNVAFGEGWSEWQLCRVLAAAFIPFGGFITARFIKTKLRTR